MSTLKVANIHFEATGTNRVEYVANNINFRTGGGNFTISVGGAETLNVNASSVMISGANVLASVAAAANCSCCLLLLPLWRLHAAGRFNVGPDAGIVVPDVGVRPGHACRR